MLFEEAFQSPEYTNFKDAVTKSTSDNRLVIKNNSVVVGKTKVPIPSFVSMDKLRDMLVEESRVLNMKYQDLYDKITVSERPERYRKEYEDTIQKLEDIKQLLDDADAFVNERNASLVTAPIEEIEHRINRNMSTMQSTLDSMADNVHVEKKKIQTVLKLYKENMGLHQSLEDARNNLGMNYVIYEHKSSDKDVVSEKTSRVKKEAKSQRSQKSRKSSAMSGGKIDEVQRAAIKTLVKKLMIDKLL